jgi:Domain of unknown function (DUF4160)
MVVRSTRERSSPIPSSSLTRKDSDMPVVFRWNGYTFFFYSNEGDPREPIHIHVERGSGSAKFWVVPDVVCAKSYGFSSLELKKVEAEVRKNKHLIVEKWNEFFRPE